MSERNRKPKLLVERWMTDGNCALEMPDVFFPTDDLGLQRAKRICATCPVKEPCLGYALRNGIDQGVWGGASVSERAKMARARKKWNGGR